MNRALFEAPQRHEADDHLRALEEPPRRGSRSAHSAEAIDVVHDLRPHEVGAGVELRLELRGIVGLGERHVGDADQVARRIRDLRARDASSPRRGSAARARPPRSAPGRTPVSRRDGRRPCIGSPAEAQDVARAERPAAEQVGRDRQAVPVAARELQGRLEPGLVRRSERPPSGDMCARRRRVVGDVHGVDVADESPRGVTDRGAVARARRHDLARDDERAGVEQRGQPARRSGSPAVGLRLGRGDRVHQEHRDRHRPDAAGNGGDRAGDLDAPRRTPRRRRARRRSGARRRRSRSPRA